MEISEIYGGETGFVLFVDFINELNSRTRHFLSKITIRYEYTISCDMLEPKLKYIYIYCQFSSTQQRFQTKDDVMMEPGGIGFDKYKMNIL